MSDWIKVGARVVALPGYCNDSIKHLTGKTGTIIRVGSGGIFKRNVLVQFDEPVGYRGIGTISGGRDGYCAYGSRECICPAPDEPGTKIKFDELF